MIIIYWSCKDVLRMFATCETVFSKNHRSRVVFPLLFIPEAPSPSLLPYPRLFIMRPCSQGEGGGGLPYKNDQKTITKELLRGTRSCFVGVARNFFLPYKRPQFLHNTLSPVIFFNLSSIPIKVLGGQRPSSEFRSES